jgi:hypothetical protein
MEATVWSRIGRIASDPELHCLLFLGWLAWNLV